MTTNSIGRVDSLKQDCCKWDYIKDMQFMSFLRDILKLEIVWRFRKEPFRCFASEFSLKAKKGDLHIFVAFACNN